MIDPGGELPAAVRRAATAGLLALMALQLVAGARAWTATSDEITHLPSGYTYLVTGDLRLNPQHPPLVKMLAALPLLAIRPEFDRRDPAWTADPPREWEFGERFLYRNDPDPLLFRGRLPLIGLALLLAWSVARLAADLFGDRAGIAALALVALSPTVLAHGRLVTMDVPVACFSTWFVHRLLRHARDGRRGDAVLAGIALGLALATKFSALVLLPVLAVLAPFAIRGADLPPRRRALAALALAGSVAGIAALVVWAVYLFPSDVGVYLDGIRQVNADHDPGRAYYLFGQFRVGGWWWYFPVAYLVKTPLPTLALLAASFLPAVRRAAPCRGGGRGLAFVAVPAVAWTAVTCALADNLGVRYLLPAIALACVLASRTVAAAWAPTSRRSGRAAVAVAAVWLAASAAWTFPDHLGYFNLAVGGSRNGWRILDDSNLDWGQDLRRLAAWLDRHDTGRVRLLYPWIGRPAHYGIDSEPMEARDWHGPPRPGTYVVASVWLVRGLYEARTRGLPTDWLTRYRPVGRVGTSFFVYRFDGPAPDNPGSH